MSKKKPKKQQKKVIKIPVKDYYDEKISNAFDYLRTQALALQRSIVDSNFYVGVDGRLYRIGAEQSYQMGVAKKVKELIDEVQQA